MIHSVYKVTARDGRFYIGQHSSTNADSGIYVGAGVWPREMIKQGRRSELLSSRQLVEFDSADDAREFEKLAIDEARASYPDTCMNIKTGGGGPRILTEEQRKRISLSSKEKWAVDREKMLSHLSRIQQMDSVKKASSDRAKNRVWSDAVKAKISASHTGKKKTKEHCANISKAKKGRAVDKGRRVEVCGVEYRSISVAVKSTGIGITAMRKWLFSPDSFINRRKVYEWVTECPKFVPGG